MDKIYQCIINLTNNCNLRCKFCFAKSKGYDKNDKIKLESLKRLFDILSESKIKYITFSGGEPLLYPEFFDAINYLHEMEYKPVVAVATNGLKLADYDFAKKILELGVGYIDISLKGKDAIEWLDITKYDGFLKQMKAINNLSKLNADYTCSMVITPENVERFCESVNNAKNAGAKQFSFTFVIDVDKNDVCDLDYLKLHNPMNLVSKFISQIELLNRITNGEWWIEYSYPLCVYTREQLDVLKGYLAGPCYIHDRDILTLELDAKSNIIPCGMLFDDVLGKWEELFSTNDEMNEYINSDKFKQSMEKFNRLPSSDCLSCSYAKSCLGGCPWFWRHCSFETFKKFKISEGYKFL